MWLMDFTDIVMALVGPAFIGLVGWLWLVHLKTHNNEIKLANLQTDLAKNYSSKDVESKIFDRLEALREAIGELRTEVRVAISAWKRNGSDRRN